MPMLLRQAEVYEARDLVVPPLVVVYPGFASFSRLQKNLDMALLRSMKSTGLVT